jgi:hypothetical protein
MNPLCKFCQNELESTSHIFSGVCECYSCHMHYIYRNGEMIWQSYRFEGISYEYHSLGIDFINKTTTLFLYHKHSLTIVTPNILVRQIIAPDTPPSEGLLLAERVYKLKAFL